MIKWARRGGVVLEAIEERVGDAPEIDERLYFCVYCMVGAEMRCVRILREKFPLMETISPVQQKWLSVNGKKQLVERAFLPGYVFFRTDSSPVWPMLRIIPDVRRVLGEMKEGYALEGADRRFAQWVFKNGGRIDISKIHRVGERIEVISGPLRTCGGRIDHIDKRARTAKVLIEFHRTTLVAWLPFDWIDEV